MKEIIIRIQIENGVFDVSTDVKELKINTDDDKYNQFVKIYQSNKRIQIQNLAEYVGVSRPTIYSWIKKYKKDLELKKV